MSDDWPSRFFQNNPRRTGKAIIQRVIRDGQLREGRHIHTVSYSQDETCHGGDSTCTLWQQQLEEAMQAWSGDE